MINQQWQLKYHNNHKVDLETIKQTTLENLEETFNTVYPLFQLKIDAVANRVLSKTTVEQFFSTAKKAFEAECKKVIKQALYSYISNKKWEVNIDSNYYFFSYIDTAIYRFGETFISEALYSYNSKITESVCPACKEYNMKEVLYYDGSDFICNNCENKIIDVKKEIDNTKDQSLEDRLFLLECFAKHSNKGVRCPTCAKFVPESARIGEELICPYPGCHSLCNEAETMKHPIALANRRKVSITQKLNSTKSKMEFIELCDIGNAYFSLDKEQTYKNNLAIIKETLLLQKTSQGKTRRIPNKLCMYEAFMSAIEKYPQEMIDYITLGGQRDGLSIQALLYQEFGDMLIKRLPIRFYQKGLEVLITNPLDSRLHLYDGIKQFSNYVDKNGVVRKRIQDKVVNDVVSPETEDAFIARLISVQDSNGNDLLDNVDSYNFIGLRMKPDKIKMGDDLVVRYYSIRPNYTLGSMIHLQRIKKRLKDSASKKINILNFIKGS